jgi:hypothetical protein
MGPTLALIAAASAVVRSVSASWTTTSPAALELPSRTSRPGAGSAMMSPSFVSVIFAPVWL